MARRKIKWTLSDLKDKMIIYDYWIAKNKSIVYPQKIENLFQKVLFLLASFPYSGQKTTAKNIRIQVVKHYKLVYQITESTIVVLRVWDTRQNPESLKIDSSF